MPVLTELFFNASARAYDLLTWQEHWREQIKQVLKYAPSELRRKRVLDIGCGPGISSFVLAEALGQDVEVLGIDFASKMIDRARHHHHKHHGQLDNVRFLVADAARLPLGSDSFDMVIGHSFLYLVSDRSQVLQSIHRILRPGGRLILLEPSKEGSLASAGQEALKNAKDHFSQSPLATLRFSASMVSWRMASWSKGGLSGYQARDLLRNAGFEQVAIDSTLAQLGMHCVGTKKDV